jgi:hypothetical protein
VNTVLRTLGVWLAVYAMVLRAAIPAGWMPAPEVSSGAPLVICTAQGFVHFAPQPAPKPWRGSLPDHGNSTCPFGALSQFAPPQLVALTLPGASTYAVRLPAPAAIFVGSSNDDAHGARAPPLLL